MGSNYLKSWNGFLTIIAISVSVAGILLLLLPGKCRAEDLASHGIMINEIFPIAGADGIEWIELYNPTDQVIDLPNCTLEDNNGLPVSPKFLHVTVSAKGYLILKQKTDFTFSLNDGGDLIILKGDGEILDQVAFGGYKKDQFPDQAPDARPGKSISRSPNGMNTGENSTDFMILDPTMGAENTKIIYPSCLQFSEIFPDLSEDSGQFVEIQNYCQEDVELSDWLIKSKDDGWIYTIEDKSVPAGRFLAFFRQTGDPPWINSDGGSIFLINPNGDPVDEVLYGAAEDGESYAIFGNEFHWTNMPTPGAENLGSTVAVGSGEPARELDIREAKQVQDDNENIVIEGLVTVEPGILSSQYFYIEDGSGGIQVYNHQSSFISLKRGDRVRVLGTVTTSNGEKRIKTELVEDIQIIGIEVAQGPTDFQLSSLADEDTGRYARTDGYVIETSGDTFTVGDESGNQINVIIRESTKIEKPRMKRGDKVTVAGILSMYRDNLRLLPFNQEDVKITVLEAQSTRSSRLPESGGDLEASLFITSIIFILWNFSPKIWKTLTKLPKMLLEI